MFADGLLKRVFFIFHALLRTLTLKKQKINYNNHNEITLGDTTNKKK